MALPDHFPAHEQSHHADGTGEEAGDAEGLHVANDANAAAQVDDLVDVNLLGVGEW